MSEPAAWTWTCSHDNDYSVAKRQSNVRLRVLAIAFLLLAVTVPAPASASTVLFEASGQHWTGSIGTACSVPALNGIESSCVELPGRYDGLRFTLEAYTLWGRPQVCFYDASYRWLGCVSGDAVPAGAAYLLIRSDYLQSAYVRWTFRILDEPGNYLANPGFETGRKDSWRDEGCDAYSGTSFQSEARVTSYGARSGSYALAVRDSSAYEECGVSQVIKIVGGRNYTASVWASVTTGSAMLTFEWLDSYGRHMSSETVRISDPASPSEPRGSWQHVSISRHAYSNVASARVTIWQDVRNVGNVVWDDLGVALGDNPVT